MALEIAEKDNETLKVVLNNGDLEALKDVVKKWNFKDEAAALRFAFTALYVTDPGKLFKEDQEGDLVMLNPTEELRTISVNI